MEEPVAVWTGWDLFRSEPIKSVTIILRTVGCAWRKCLMCGYHTDCAPGMGHAEIMHQFRLAKKKFPDEEFIVKIYTSGSFFDEREISIETREEIMKQLGADKRVKKLIVESRPEFLTPEKIERGVELLQSFEVGIGLETSNDVIRERCIKKGFNFLDFLHASEMVRKCGAEVRVYLLLKPPFLSEKEAVEDIINSVRDVSPYADIVSINPCNVQDGTFLKGMWRLGDYRPPWLWSVVEVLRKTEGVVISDPVGAGSKRGPHNCGRCDREVARAIREFSISQERKVLESLDCECRRKWNAIMEFEEFSFGSPYSSL
ncbi:MAG: archaeosine biosynthesis radical SAM protein RaSEA [Candidatus Syntropharchaeia archaeon]